MKSTGNVGDNASSLNLTPASPKVEPMPERDAANRPNAKLTPPKASGPDYQPKR